MARLHKITAQADGMLRDIACSARGVVWRCDELNGLAMYPNRVLHNIKYRVNEIKGKLKDLQAELGEPEEVGCFNGDTKKC